MPTPLKNVKVKWDYCSQYMEKYKMFQTTKQYTATRHQPATATAATAESLRRRAGGHSWQASATTPAAQVKGIGSGAVARGADLRTTQLEVSHLEPKKIKAR